MTSNRPSVTSVPDESWRARIVTDPPKKAVLLPTTPQGSFGPDLPKALGRGAVLAGLRGSPRWPAKEPVRRIGQELGRTTEMLADLALCQVRITIQNGACDASVFLQ